MLYLYPDRVSLQVRFLPKDGAQVGEQSFDLVFGRSGPPGARRWLVTSWLPNGFGVAGPRATRRVDGIDLRPTSSGQGQLGAAWLALPAGLLGLGLAARAWHRHRRALRSYKVSSSTRG